MQASMAQQAGKPIISDQEYDDLKNELRTKGSIVISQVSLRSLHGITGRIDGDEVC